MGGSVYYHNYNNCNSIKKIVCCTYETRSYYREYTYIHTYVHTHIHTYIHVVTTVVTASSICGIRQFFQIFLRKKKKIERKKQQSTRGRKASRPRNRKKKTEISYFSAETRVHRELENCASSATQTRPIQWTKTNYTASIHHFHLPVSERPCRSTL